MALATYRVLIQINNIIPIIWEIIICQPLRETKVLMGNDSYHPLFENIGAQKDEGQILNRPFNFCLTLGKFLKSSML